MYTEIQRVPYRVYAMAFAIIIVLVGGYYFFSITNESSFDDPGFRRFIRLIALGPLLLMLLFFYVIIYRTITTQIDDESVRFRVSPLSVKWQVIPWKEIERAYVREYALVGEYPRGSGGIRQGPNGWVYALNGTYGLQIEKKSGGKILVGTMNPAELKAFLDKNFSSVSA